MKSNGGGECRMLTRMYRLARTIRSTWNADGGAFMPTTRVFFPPGIATQRARLHIWSKRAKDFGKVKACCSAGKWNGRGKRNCFRTTWPGSSSGSAKCGSCCSLAHGGMIRLGSTSPPCCRVWLNHGPHDGWVGSQSLGTQLG